MVLVVKCLICAKELTYTQNDPSQLYEHVRSEHPQRTRNFVETQAADERRENATKNLRESLGRNSASLLNLIDKEAQTDISWKYFERMSSRKADNIVNSTPRSSKDNIIEIFDSRRTSKASKESSSSSTSANNITVINKTKHSSRPNTTNIIQSKLNEKSPLKTSSPSISMNHQQSVRQDKVEMQVGRDAKVLFTSGDKPARSNREKRHHRRIFKTSIEKWRPINDEKILCPRCQSLKRPIIRTHNERLTESSLAATLIMTCWPFCFAPCLFPEPTHENLHCPVCDYHLGIYDHKQKITLPNPELLQN